MIQLLSTANLWNARNGRACLLLLCIGAKIPSSEMSHFRTLLTGKAKSAISGMGHSGAIYTQAWALFERKFGNQHLIVDAQLETLRKQGDLQLSATLCLAIEKLPPILY